MIRGLILVLALAGPAIAQNDKVKLPFVGDAGATRCDKWLSERDETASLLAFGLEDWVLGFVSGSYNAVAGDLDFDKNDVLTRTVFYCREHRTDILAVAALRVTVDLLDTEASRMRRGPKKR